MFHSSSPKNHGALDPEAFLHDLSTLNERYHELLEEDKKVHSSPLLHLDTSPEETPTGADSSEELAGSTKQLSGDLADLQIGVLDLDVLRQQIQQLYEGTLARITQNNPDLQDELDLSIYRAHSFKPANAALETQTRRAAPPEDVRGVISEVLPDGSFRLDPLAVHKAKSLRIRPIDENGNSKVSIKFL